MAPSTDAGIYGGGRRASRPDAVWTSSTNGVRTVSTSSTNGVRTVLTNSTSDAERYSPSRRSAPMAVSLSVVIQNGGIDARR